MERLAAPNGPTKGKIVRPSDDKEPESIAFVQCAGSRDENYLPYCSYICCMASLKQATYVRERYPEAKIYVFYIDLRAPGYRYERFYENIKEDENIFLIKGKVAEVNKHYRGCLKCRYRREDPPDRGHGCSGHRHATHNSHSQTSGRSQL